MRGYGPGRFSFNVKGGRCEACHGHGKKRVRMHFLPDVWVTCKECGGRRYNHETLQITFKGKSVADVLEMDIQEARGFYEAHPKIIRRLQTLHDVGLDYLKLGQSATTLSGGEAQRIRLATQIGSGLVGVLYVLDEPTIGLHPRDSMRLVSTLKRLRDMGNTVLVVEHDAQIMNCSDDIIDVGPGAGLNGGEIVFHGTPEEIRESDTSLTGKYLSGRLTIPVPENRRPPSGRFIIIEGASENNLRDIDIRIPADVFTCVTGVSGSGKSTMVIETVYKALRRRLNRYRGKSGRIKQIRDFGGIERVITMDQQPIGRTPRSNPATYTGVLTHVRDLFSQLPDSRMRGYKPGRFSFNVKGEMRGMSGGKG